MASRKTNLGHDGLSICTLDVAEWHLGALVLVEDEIRIVKILNLVQWS